jgi:hypothetical protein
MRKKMKFIGLFFIILLFAAFSNSKAVSKSVNYFPSDSLYKTNDTITVSGTALNAKMGAFLQTEKDIYYISELSFWPDSLYNKKVEVKGILKIETFREEDLKDEYGNWKQGMIGEKKTILMSNYRIIGKEE